MDTYQKSLTDENRDLMVAAGATSLRSKTTDHGKASDHGVISKAGGASFTGRTFAGSVRARYLRGRLVARDGHLSMGGRVESSGHLECSGSESFSLWLLDVLREDGVVTANDPVRFTSVGLGWWGNASSESRRPEAVAVRNPIQEETS